jgi:hypothetical protein
MQESLCEKESDLDSVDSKGAKESLVDVARSLADAKASITRDSKMISESTAALERYWKQARWYQGFIGMGVTLILAGGAFGMYYLRSADRVLSQAHVSLTSEPGSKGVRLTLSGENIRASGRSDHQVVVEFSK